MIRYRPQKGTLEEALQKERKFTTVNAMLSFVKENTARSFHDFVETGDITVSENFGKDERTDWKETRYVYVKYRGEKYPVGMCSIE